MDAFGERQLAAAVIGTAFADIAAIPAACAGENNASRPLPTQKEEAVLFLTAEDGRWARSRVAWADQVGIDADAIRQKAVRLLAGAR